MPLVNGHLALTDLKGQLCGKLLRDFGFEVIKVEPPGGDPVRRLGPFKDEEPARPRGSVGWTTTTRPAPPVVKQRR